MRWVLAAVLVFTGVVVWGSKEPAPTSGMTPSQVVAYVDGGGEIHTAYWLLADEAVDALAAKYGETPDRIVMTARVAAEDTGEPVLAVLYGAVESSEPAYFDAVVDYARRVN